MRRYLWLGRIAANESDLLIEEIRLKPGQKERIEEVIRDAEPAMSERLRPAPNGRDISFDCQVRDVPRGTCRRLWSGTSGEATGSPRGGPRGTMLPYVLAQEH